MRAGLLAFLALQSASAALGSPTARDATTEDALDHLSSLAKSAYEKAQTDLSDGAVSKRGSTCSLSNIQVRREWGTLSKEDRREYIRAAKCLQSKPALTPASLASGAETRFDDFVATHINQTLAIHYTGNFLSWHRYYTWLYEKALQDECGYTGTQPYWDWPQTAISGLEKSSVFDGSDTSMSGNGEYVPNQGDIILGNGTGLPPITLPPGNGGGCVTNGPFANFTVNLGPAALDSPGGVVVTNPNGPLTHNPRCLRRSLTDEVNQQYANASATLSLILKPQNVWDFQMQMQGVPGSGNIGVHGGGHYSLGGDPGDDVYTSPGDPAFYLHHSQIDRVWWIWQMLSPAERIWSDDAVIGANTFLNDPPSANTTLDDYVNYGYATGPPRKIRDLMSIVDGPFCYIYL